MEKTRFSAVDETKEFYVIEQTVIGGVPYLLVADSEEEEAEAWILKDLSKPGEKDAVYTAVEDEEELAAVSRIFQEMLEDVEIDLS